MNFIRDDSEMKKIRLENQSSKNQSRKKFISLMKSSSLQIKLEGSNETLRNIIQV